MGKSQAAASGGNREVIETALSIMDNGGNAVDGAIGAYLMACISEPCMASLAGGALILLGDASGNVKCLDGFCNTPKHKCSVPNLDYFPIEVDFGDAKETFYGGLGAVAVPKISKALYDLHENYGHMPLPEVAHPAIQSARSGVALSDFQSHDLVLLSTVFKNDPILRDIFYDNDQLIKAGSPVVMNEFSDFLSYWANSKSDDFYLGEFGKSLLELSRNYGGHICRDDLKHVEAKWTSPKASQLGDFTLVTPGSPSFGAYLIRQALQNYKGSHQKLTPQSLVRGILEISTSSKLEFTGFSNLMARGTSHFNVMDKKGDFVAMTYTIGEGSGRVVPGTGVHLNNMLGEMSLMPGGSHSWVPGKAMATMMSPLALFSQNCEKILLAGSGGASRIPTALLQTILQWVNSTDQINEVIHMPRIHFDGELWQVEPGFHAVDLLDSTGPVNVWAEPNMYFGGVHAIVKAMDYVHAVGDQRRSGFGAQL